MKTHPIPNLFVDQDGVLADLDTHYRTHFGKSSAHPGEFSAEEFWSSVNSVPDFWRTIPAFDGLPAFWQTLTEMHGNPVILTSISSPLADPSTRQQKIDWVHAHLGAHVRVITCRGSDKKLYCEPGDWLIDDWDRYQKPWVQHGGVFLHHTTYDTTLSELAPRIHWAKINADHRTMFRAYDGSMMCETHPGQPWKRCDGGESCVGPGVPWLISGKTAILSFLKERV